MHDGISCLRSFMIYYTLLSKTRSDILLSSAFLSCSQKFSHSHLSATTTLLTAHTTTTPAHSLTHTTFPLPPPRDGMSGGALHTTCTPPTTCTVYLPHLTAPPTGMLLHAHAHCLRHCCLDINSPLHAFYRTACTCIFTRTHARLCRLWGTLCWEWIIFIACHTPCTPHLPPLLSGDRSHAVDRLWNDQC